MSFLTNNTEQNMDHLLLLFAFLTCLNSIYYIPNNKIRNKRDPRYRIEVHVDFTVRCFISNSYKNVPNDFWLIRIEPAKV